MSSTAGNWSSRQKADESKKAELVTSDAEFKPLENEIKIAWLK